MTQQQLKDLITNSLGPIIDQAIRVAGPHPAQVTFPQDAKTIGSWSLLTQLQYYIDYARHNGDLPAVPATGPSGVGYRGDTDWPSSDWAAIVAA